MSDWNRVAVEHVREACGRYDAGVERPRSPARNTTLLFDGGRYPAKFIRGLAYRIATGNGPGVYQGGRETVRFFNRLGLSVEYDGGVEPAHGSPEPSIAAEPSLASALEPQPVAHSGVVSQKQALLALLERRLGQIRKEAAFDWLIVPDIAEMSGAIATVHEALAAHRGHTRFATPGRRLNCDFYVPACRLLIEYDERQHFTVPRSIALRLYPDGLPLHFDRDEWIANCEKIRANDPTPPQRDETRAFYDALRDLRACENNHAIIRLRDGAFDWHRPDAAEMLEKVILQAAGHRMLRPHPQDRPREPRLPQA